MPDFLRKFIGLLLIFAAVGVASCQALVASCSSDAVAAPAVQALR
jgi:hypothetical protein